MRADWETLHGAPELCFVRLLYRKMSHPPPGAEVLDMWPRAPRVPDRDAGNPGREDMAGITVLFPARPWVGGQAVLEGGVDIIGVMERTMVG